MNQDKIKKLNERIQKTKDIMQPRAPYEFVKHKTTHKPVRLRGKQYRTQSANDPTLRTQQQKAYVTAAHLTLSAEHMEALNQTRITLLELRTQNQQQQHVFLFDLLLSHVIVFLYHFDTPVVQEFLPLLGDKYQTPFKSIHAKFQHRFLKDKQIL